MALSVRNKFFSYLLTTILVLAACAPATSLPTLTIVPTITAPVPTATITSTATTAPGSTPIAIHPKITEQCVDIVQKQPSEMGIDPSYRIIMIGYNEIDLSLRKGPAPDSYLLNPNTGEKIILRKKTVNTWLDLYSASPDGKWFEYFANTPSYRRMFLLKPDGTMVQTEISQQTGKYFYKPIGWTNGHKVLLQRDYVESKKGLLIYDPVTNKQVEDAQDYPHAKFEDITAYFSYSPLMDRVAYMDANFNVALYDLSAQKEIKSVNKITYELMYPVWSNDGKYLAFVRMEKDENKQELYLINKDGELHRLTFFSDQYDETHIYGVSWSPDNRHIAFSPQHIKYSGQSPSPDEKVEATLKIIDIRSKDMIDLCIYGDSQALYWSPDGKYLLTNQDTATLIDMENRHAIKFEAEMRAGGWLKFEDALATPKSTP
jgi:Tol biopolymer transport system component